MWRCSLFSTHREVTWFHHLGLLRSFTNSRVQSATEKEKTLCVLSNAEIQQLIFVIVNITTGKYSFVCWGITCNIFLLDLHSDLSRCTDAELNILS